MQLLNLPRSSSTPPVRPLLSAAAAAADRRPVTSARGGELSAPVTGQPAVVGVPVHAVPTPEAGGSDDQQPAPEQRTRFGGRKVQPLEPPPASDPPPAASERAKGSRKWFGPSQSEKDLRAMQARLSGLGEEEQQQVDGAARYLQTRWRAMKHDVMMTEYMRTMYSQPDLEKARKHAESFLPKDRHGRLYPHSPRVAHGRRPAG